MSPRRMSARDLKKFLQKLFSRFSKLNSRTLYTAFVASSVDKQNALIDILDNVGSVIASLECEGNTEFDGIVKHKQAQLQKTLGVFITEVARNLSASELHGFDERTMRARAATARNITDFFNELDDFDCDIQFEVKSLDMVRVAMTTIWGDAV